MFRIADKTSGALILVQIVQSVQGILLKRTKGLNLTIEPVYFKILLFPPPVSPPVSCVVSLSHSGQGP